jgi:RNA polymerase sigma-70 factor (ECF subfamily)
MADDTKEIVLRARGGDLEAFGRLVRRHELGVRAFLAARLDDRHEAEDLAQEVFITAYRNLETFAPDRPLSAWLRGIASNLLRNHLRKRRESSGADAFLAGLVDKVVPDPGRAVEALRRCVEGLDAPSRELVDRRYTQDQPLAEIGQALDLKHSALTMNLHRLRIRLRDCMQRRVAEEAR